MARDLSKNGARWLLLGIVLAAFFLRLPGLFGNTFHADEALFASWARHIAVWKDPLLLTQAVDKPPLLFYMQALFYPLQGPVEWAARLPNFIVSILLIPLTAVLFWRLYANRWGMIGTAVIVAFAPLTIQFSSTAFTDPLLTFWLVAAGASMQVSGVQVSGNSLPHHPTTSAPQHLSTSAPQNLNTSAPQHFSTSTPQHPLTAGLLFGLALATKYQALLFLPLLLGFGWLAGYGRRHWLRWVGGAAVVVAMVLVWEFARTGTFSLWANQVRNFGGVRLAWSGELGLRFGEWAALGQTAVSPLVLLLILMSLVLLLGQGNSQDRLLCLFVMGYMLLHWLLAVPVWDRYLLPLLPLVAILGARGVMILGYWDIGIFKRPISQSLNLQSLTIILLIAILILPAFGARHGRYPLGGQRLADDGAAQIAAYLQDAPYGTVLYDHWYSWHWRYHFFDKGVYVSWFSDGKALVEELTVFGDDGQDHYLALPDTAVADPVLRAVAVAGFQLQPIAKEGKITLYKIVPAEVQGD